jgi:hypothetical protein
VISLLNLSISSSLLFRDLWCHRLLKESTETNSKKLIRTQRSSQQPSTESEAGCNEGWGGFMYVKKSENKARACFQQEVGRLKKKPELGVP